MNSDVPLLSSAALPDGIRRRPSRFRPLSCRPGSSHFHSSNPCAIRVKGDLPKSQDLGERGKKRDRFPNLPIPLQCPRRYQFNTDPSSQPDPQVRTVNLARIQSRCGRKNSTGRSVQFLVLFLLLLSSLLVVVVPDPSAAPLLCPRPLKNPHGPGHPLPADDDITTLVRHALQSVLPLLQDHVPEIGPPGALHALRGADAFRGAQEP